MDEPQREARVATGGTIERQEEEPGGQRPYAAPSHAPRGRWLEQLKVQQRKDVWRAIAAKVRALQVSNQRRTHCHKRWDDISRLAKDVAEMTLGLLPRTGRSARCSMTPLMGRILAVIPPELDAHLKEHRQQGRDTPVDTEGQEPDISGGETSTTAAQEPSDTDVTSASEGGPSMQEESLPETQSTKSSDASRGCIHVGRHREL
ncbi:uncharacterized protein LOC144768549 [Lissotriton helveticus]